jgi:hypothetical protein
MDVGIAILGACLIALLLHALITSMQHATCIDNIFNRVEKRTIIISLSVYNIY